MHGFLTNQVCMDSYGLMTQVSDAKETVFSVQTDLMIQVSKKVQACLCVARKSHLQAQHSLTSGLVAVSSSFFASLSLIRCVYFCQAGGDPEAAGDDSSPSSCNTLSVWSASVWFVWLETRGAAADIVARGITAACLLCGGGWERVWTMLGGSWKCTGLSFPFL